MSGDKEKTKSRSKKRKNDHDQKGSSDTDIKSKKHAKKEKSEEPKVFLTEEEEKIAISEFNIMKAERHPKYTPEIIQKLEPFTAKWMSLEACMKLEKELGVQYRRGKLSKKEEQIMETGFQEYLKARGIAREDFLNSLLLRSRGTPVRSSKKSTEFSENQTTDNRLCVDNSELYVTLAKLLKTRPVMLVYVHFIRRYHPSKQKIRGNFWNAEMDRRLKGLVELHGFEWEKIGKEMDRTGIDCRDRFRAMRNNSGPWSKEEVDKLIHLVHQVFRLQKTKLDNQEVMIKKEGEDTKKIDLPWIYISDQMKTRSITQCYTKWFDISNPFHQRSTWTSSDDYRLCLKIWDLNVDDESEIIWREFVKPLETDFLLRNVNEPSILSAEAKEKLSQSREAGYFVHSPTKLQNRFKILRKRIAGEKQLDLDSKHFLIF